MYFVVFSVFIKKDVRPTTLPLGPLLPSTSMTKWVFQMVNDPKHTSKVVAKWLKDNKFKVLEWQSQSPDLKPTENLWAELKTHVRARRPTNLTQLHQLCQEEWAKIHPTYCGKLVEGYTKRLTQVKQFKGNATKY